MANTGKCPSCNQVLRSVTVEAIDVVRSDQVTFKGASFVCPMCRTILTVCFDQLFIRNEIRTAIKEALKR